MQVTITGIEKDKAEIEVSVLYVDDKINHPQAFRFSSEQFEQMTNEDLVEYVKGFGLTLIKAKQKEEVYRELLDQTFEIEVEVEVEEEEEEVEDK